MSRPARIAVMSDLHLEAEAWVPPRFAADLVVLAGDVAHGTDGVAWAARELAGMPVIYVAGNHEHWEAADAASARAALAAAAAATENVRFLDDSKLEFYAAGKCFRILGGTLWFDFAAHGEDLRARRMAELEESARDFRNIRVAGRALAPDDVLAWHRRSLAWLTAELEREFAGITMVVTHHAPSLLSLAPHRRARPAAAGTASALEALIERTRPPLWIHGHTHDDADYTLGATRVVSRQRGAPRDGAFAPLIVEIA